MLIVNKDSIKATRQKLDDPGKKQEAIDDIKRMLEIKQTLLWRAEAGSCCGSLCHVSSYLAREADILENVLSAMEKGETPEAIRLLKEYEHIIEANCEPIQPEHC